MAPAHTTEAVTVGALLGGMRLFGVPPYQRDYSWTWREADQLIADLLAELQAMQDAPGEERSYYIGLVIIIDNTPQRRAMTRFRRGTQSPSEVVDGKQRLTTLTMLIALLRDLLGSDGQWLQTYLTETGKSRPWPKDTPRLLLDDHEQEFLVEHVLPHGGNLQPAPKDLAHESIRRMGSVRDHMRRVLQGRKPEFLASLARMLVDQCEMTAIVPKDIASGYRMFVTVNFRGKGLSTNDIVKAELIGSMDQSGRRKATDRWLALRDRLELPSDDPEQAKHAASLDNLLSHVHKLRCKPSSSIFRGIADLANAAADPLTFMTDTLEPLGDIMLAVKRAAHSDCPLSPEINRVLTTLNWLPANDWVPVAMAALHSHVRAPQKALETLAHLQRLAYALAVLGRGNDLREARYRRCVQNIANAVPPATPGSPLILDDDECEAVSQLVMSNLYRTKGNYCRAVLAWIAAVNGQSEMPANLRDWSVEHILPRTPADNAYWQKRFANPKVRDACIRSLGNLTLVTAAQNRKVKNHGYPEKIAVYFEAGSASPFDTTRMLEDIGEWTPEAVLARETMMFARVAKAWGLKTRNRSKLALLLKP
jgi:hypothetical protein